MEFKLHQKEKQKNRLASIAENTMLVFSLANGEMFSGKKENIAKNYSMLPKDSLVSKDGVEADLERLRKDRLKNKVIVHDKQ